MKHYLLTGAVCVSVLSLVGNPAVSAPGQKLCVSAKHLKTGLEVKKAPDSSSETVRVIGAGRVIMEFGRENGWVYGGVERAGGVDGYVPENSLQATDLDGMKCGS